MNFQVQPLKVLATREVVMNRMDYSTFLTSTTKDELDRLDNLGSAVETDMWTEGCFRKTLFQTIEV